MHAQEVVELILKKAGKDVLKQIELAAAVKDRLTDVNPNKDLPVGLAIVESVKLVQGDQEQVQGQVPQRYLQPLPRRAAGCQLSRCEAFRCRSLARHIESPLEGRPRSLWAFTEGKIKDLVEFRGKMRSDKFSEGWAEELAEFIVETRCSDRCTRVSERSSDEMRNPNTKKDPEWYRLHFLEKKILTIIGSTRVVVLS